MAKNLWTRDELLIALNLYYKFPYGQFHTSNPVIIEVARKLERSPSALIMKLCNFGSLDSRNQKRGVQELKGGGKADREIWQEFEDNWDKLAYESEEKLLLPNLRGKMQTIKSLKCLLDKGLSDSNDYFY